MQVLGSVRAPFRIFDMELSVQLLALCRAVIESILLGVGGSGVTSINPSFSDSVAARSTEGTWPSSPHEQDMASAGTLPASSAVSATSCWST